VKGKGKCMEGWKEAHMRRVRTGGRAACVLVWWEEGRGTREGSEWK